MSEGTDSYDASQIQVLEGWKAVRMQPGTYIGSTGERGLLHLVFEVADRAFNEALAGHASCVEVTLMPDGGVCVADGGPGVGIDLVGSLGISGLEALMTRLQFRARSGGRHDVTRTPWSMGPCVCQCAVEPDDGRSAARGSPLGPGVRARRGRHPAHRGGASTESGTTITFWPDADIFGTSEQTFDGLAERFKELALLNRDLEIHLTDRRQPGEPRSAQFRYPGGARDFVSFLDEQEKAPVPPDIIGFEWEEPRMAGTVEVALRWRGSPGERIRSFANSRPASGGTHELGFRDGLVAALTAYARKRQLLTATDPDLDAERVGEGLTAVVSVKLDHPEFAGSTRDEVGNTAARACVEQAVREHLEGWLDGHPEQAATVVERITQGTSPD